MYVRNKKFKSPKLNTFPIEMLVAKEAKGKSKIIIRSIRLIVVKLRSNVAPKAIEASEVNQVLKIAT